jgi:O-antigen/teichoic acid export membrane protein
MLRARRLFSTTLIALVLVSLVGIAAVGLFILLLASGRLVFDSELMHSLPAVMTVCMLAMSVFVSFFAEPFAAKLRAAGHADVGIGLNGVLPWIEVGCSAVALSISATFVSLAAATLVSRLLFVALSLWLSMKAAVGVYFEWSAVELSEIGSLLRKGVAYQAFPLGNALSNQAMLVVVGAALGPLSVAMFGTARTMARLGTQIMELINHAVWPEMTLLLGGRDYARAAAVHRAAAAYTVAAGAITAVGAITVGPWLFKTWTVGELSVTHSLMAMFGAAILLQSIWHASLIVQLAVNEHEGVAVRYVIGSLAAVICCWPLSQAFGLYGAAASSMAIDALLIPYCLVKALAITHDTLPHFLAGLVPAARHGVDIARKRAVPSP